MKQVPNLFTLLNLVFGCIAIICVLQSGVIIAYDPDSGAQFLGTPEKFWMASLFIALAGVVDFLDGFIARLFKSTSPLGKQLDSLADMVSFGVAPAMIVYQFLRLSIAGEPDGLEASIGWLLPALIVPCAAAWRLGRFNLDESQQYGFKGMPTPAVGLLVASIPLIYWFREVNTALLLNKWFWYAVIVLLSYLMVSRLPLMALKFRDLSLKNNISKIVLVVIAIVAALFLRWLAVPVVFVGYIAVSLAFRDKQ